MSARNQPFRVIEGGRSLPAFVPDEPRRDDLSAAEGVLIGVALGAPMWLGLSALAWWAHGVLGWQR